MGASTVQLTVRVPLWLHQQISNQAEGNGQTNSAEVRAALIEKFAKQGKGPQ